MIWRDIKVRYKQTALGILWIVLQPFVTIAIFSALFGRLLGVPLRRCPISHLPICRPIAMAVFRQFVEPLLHQPSRQRPSHHQGLFPSTGDSHFRRAWGSGGFWCGFLGAGGADGLFPSRAYDGRNFLARLFAAGYADVAGLWPVALGAERTLPG